MKFAKYHEERNLSGHLLRRYKRTLKNFDPLILESLLEYSKGWSEVDIFCQSIFGAKDLLSRWEERKKLLTNLRIDKKPEKKKSKPRSPHKTS